MIGKEDILDALREVIDPEIGVNVTDLGLVYEAGEKDGAISVKMTMTTAACPLGGLIRDQARNVLKKRFPAAASVDVELVWSPPWSADMMSAEARRKLGIK